MAENTGLNKTYLLIQHEKFGRCAVAARDLEAGEEILTETAAVVGPKHHTAPICLGCLVLTSSSYTCSRCCWPVCGPRCEDLPAHRDAECKVFAKARAKFVFPPDLKDDPEFECPQLECITPLRLLLTTQSKRWENEVSLMEDHAQVRRDGADWQADQVNIVGYIRQCCGAALTELGFSTDEELLHKICGILAVNAFEAHSRNSSGTNAIRTLFPQLALLAHNCIPNTSHSITSNYKVRVRTTIRVPKGELLFTTYTHTLSPTPTRREHLLLSKYFGCACARCSDPTELGSNLSTIKCPKCDLGWITSTKPLDAASDWQCSNCKFTMPGDAMLSVLEALAREVSVLEENDLQGRETLLKKYRGSLHPRHAHMTAIKVALSQLYGRVEGFSLQELPDVVLERKVELCRDVLDVADIVEPGLTRLRGTTLYELHAPLLMLARSRFQQGIVEGPELMARMHEAADTLEESIKILEHEEKDSTEWQLAAQSRVALQQLRETIEELPKKLDLP